VATLLLIDDDPNVHEAVERPLAGVIDRFLHATAPEDGLRLALAELPDVILLDVNMPGIDGLKICRLLKEASATRDIPVLFLTIERNVGNLARAFDIGGSDYIVKPFNEVELRARVSVAVRTKRAFDLLKEQARVDALTGLENRVALEASLAAALASHERTGSPLSLLLLDLDGFKEINDRYGHGIGDDLLRRVGACLRKGSRPYDVPCRYGGDEFVVLLGQTEGAAARKVAERILAGLRDVPFEVRGVRVPICASGGLATSASMRCDFSADDLMKAADRALYVAKRRGGDQIVDAAATSDS
jgi:two-component system cell cycle response regulator